MELQLTFDLLPVVAVLISVVGFFVPVFSQKYASMSPDYKQLLYAGIILVVGVGTALLSYFGFVDVYGDPSWTVKDWVWFPLVDVIGALIASSGTYKSFNYVADKLPSK